MTGVVDKTVLITGAGGGLGRAAAELFARAGARVALTDCNAGTLAETVASVRALGAEAVSRSGDIADSATSRELVTAAVDRFGGLDGVCNIAGVLSTGTIENSTVVEFDRAMHINCLAQLLVIQNALPALRRSQGASIVNVASVGALAALPLMTIYCASKAAVLGLTRAVAAELAPAIRCNAICPGGIDTPMSRDLLAGFEPQQREAMIAKLTGRQLLKRFAAPEEVAATLVFLISDEASFLTGAVVPVDGGMSAW